jgi:hypothetical protein
MHAKTCLRLFFKKLPNIDADHEPLTDYREEVLAAAS